MIKQKKREKKAIDRKLSLNRLYLFIYSKFVETGATFSEDVAFPQVKCLRFDIQHEGLFPRFKQENSSPERINTEKEQ